MMLALSYKRQREWAQAADTWQSMIAQGTGGAGPYIELAKYYEHVVKDIPRALSCANGALRYLLNVVPLAGMDETEMEKIRRRIERLHRKIERDHQAGGRQP